MKTSRSLPEEGPKPGCRCGIALGSNLGDRLAHLRAARVALEELNRAPFTPLFSSVYETEPVECDPGAPPYLNAVVEIGFDAVPEALFEALREIEHRLGRPAQRPLNAPRIIDLDLLYAGAQVVATRDLVLPHPRLHLRRFVLEPLSETRPDLVPPGLTKSVADLLAEMPERPFVTRVSTSWNEYNRLNP